MPERFGTIAELVRRGCAGRIVLSCGMTGDEAVDTMTMQNPARILAA